MVAPAFPLINGQRYDYSCVKASANGKLYFGFRSVTYKAGLKPGHARGTTSRIIGRTRGVADFSGGFEMYKEEYALLVAELALLSPTGGYGEVEFPISVAYQLPNGRMVLDELMQCRIVSDEDQHQEGEEPLFVRVELDVLDVERDGRSIVGQLL